MKRKIGMVVHRSRVEAQTLAKEAIVWLRERDIEARVDKQTAAQIGHPELGCEERELLDVEFLVTLGGDGTILRTARAAAPLGLPILGVHMGRFGFIAEAHPDDLFAYLDAILQGLMPIEERLMIQGEVWRGEECVYRRVGLNEAVVKSGMSHLLHLRMRLAGAEFATYPADGIIVAVPTGSTAYSLSAGGPLVAPTVQALIITPICPHTLSARPMVVPADELIEIEVEGGDDDIVFDVDGIEPFALQNSDRLVARRAEYATRLIVIRPGGFYRKVRARYLYGERLNG